MKIFRCAAVFLAFGGLMLIGCSDQSQSPVAPVDQNNLEKAIITNVTFTDTPIGLTGEGEVRLSGRRWIMKDYGVIEQFTSSDPLMNGTMVHYLSLSIDIETGEGPCQGKGILTPDDAGGGYWEGTYHGYRSKTEIPGVWTLPLKWVAKGKGGTIDGMISYATDVLTIITDGQTTLPSGWIGTGEGYYKSH